MMFKDILLVETVVEKLKHLEHAEDHPINHDYEGARHAIDTLHAVHEALKGNKSGALITTKYDGSPSIVFGRHPETGKFFVATKSAFNKTPKLNYTEKDIDANHESEGLRSKLKTALKELPRVAPPEGVYQGDVMYTKEDIHHDGKLFHFKPNTINYAAHQDSEHGRKIKAAHIGIVVHTKYHGDDFENMKAGFDVDHNNFGTNSRVHIIDPTVNTKKIHHSPENQRAFQKHISEATSIASNMSYDHHRIHRDHLKMHINKQVADNQKPSSASYKKYLADRAIADQSKVKTDAAKQRIADKYRFLQDDVKKHKEDFDNTFKLHHHIQEAKNALVHSLSSHTEFAHSVDDTPVKPEGFVATIDGKPTKLVDRHEFSRLNFLKSANRKKQDEPTTD